MPKRPGEPSWHGSHPALSGEDAPDTSAPTALRTSEAGRYERGHLLGWGGMGRVHATYDLRLRREVALKEVGDDRNAGARLAREAWIAAQLEHPGIVPIYDAGHGPDGAPFYTMRLIRGRTLADSLAGCDGRQARLRLLRHFLDACHAVAYAHSLGIVHRDLKPANIMVGEFGETQVVDWGLARAQGAGDRGSAGGTPQWMSPEQARGAPSEPPADVWALGVVLYEILEGRRPFLGPDDHVLELVRRGEVPALSDGAPPELAAVVGRCLRAEAEARYVTARELADDVEAWLYGRPVDAYPYTLRELLIRFLKAHRLPLAALASALVGVVTAATVAGVRIEGERSRAVLAEAETRAALRTADQHFARSLLGQSRSALDAQAWPEAEVLATHALTLEPSPEARGILSALAGSPRLRLLSREPAPCRQGRLSSDGAWLLCLDEEGVSLWTTAPAAQVWSRAGAVHEAAVTTSGLAVLRTGHGELLLLDTASRAREIPVQSGERLAATAGASVALVGPGGVRVLNAETGLHRSWTVCPDETPTDAVALGPAGELAVLCSSGVLWLRRDGELVVVRDDLPEAAVALAFDNATDHLVAAYRDGELHRIGVDGPPTPVDIADLGRLRSVLVTGQGLVVADGERGGPMLVDGDHWRARLPASVRQVRVDGDRLIGLGDALTWWEAPDVRPVQRVFRAHGLTSVDISPDGRSIVTADGGGAAHLVSVTDGRMQARIQFQDRVAKAAAFSADGAEIGVTTMGSPGIHVFGTADGAEVAHLSTETTRYRRLGALADGTWIGLGYGASPWLWRDGVVLEGERASDMVDLDVAPGAVEAVALTQEGRVLRLGRRLHPLYVDPAATRVAVSNDGRLAVGRMDGRVALVASNGSRTALLELEGGPVLDVAWSPDGGRLAAGVLDGRTWILRADGALEAVLPPHAERVSALAFAPDGTWLATASWDGSVRRWDLTVLDADPDTLAADARRAWGITLDQAIRAPY